MDYDLGNMMACDPSPVDAERLRADPAGACLEMATRITQSLVARLFELPSEVRPSGCSWSHLLTPWQARHCIASKP